MPESIPFGDIIVIGAIALFIILRFRSVLGQKTGHDFSKKPTKPNGAGNDNVVQLKQFDAVMGAPAQDGREDDALEGIEDDDVKDGLRDIRAKDAQFNVAEFLKGAGGAFEMVLVAFSKHDKETLKMLLDKPVYESFADVIAEREKKKETAQTTLVAIKSAQIKSAELVKNKAVVTVEFLSEQINLVLNEQGEVIEGSASEIEEVEDEWRFERDVKSPNPNWHITDV